MSESFEALMDSCLAELFEQKLHRVLEAEGFRETLRIPHPHVTEYQKDSEVISFRTEQDRAHQRRVMLESESLDVDRLVGMASRDVVVDVCAQMLGCMPKVDVAVARKEVRGLIERLGLPVE